MIFILLPDIQQFLFTLDGWQFSSPAMADYAGIIEREFPGYAGSVTIFYDGLPVCGRCK